MVSANSTRNKTDDLEENDMTEFMVWWEDSIAMTFVVESYSRVSEAFARVSELRGYGIEVLPVIRRSVEV